MVWLMAAFYVIAFSLVYIFGYILFFSGPKKGSVQESWTQIDPELRAREKRRKLAAFFAFLGSFGFLFLAVAGLIYNSYNPNRFTWDAVDAEVLSVGRYPSGELKNCYVQYDYQGKRYRQTIRGDLDSKLQRNAKLAILVNPEEPLRIEVRRNFFFLPFVVASLSILTLIFGFGEALCCLLGRAHFAIESEETPKTFGLGPVPTRIIRGKGISVGLRNTKE